MSPEQSAVIDRLIRENQWRVARFQADRLVSLLSCMKAYRIALPSWCRGALAVRP
ncbi:MAG: hypothetical protein V4537_18190 [Pseudomonadota bacterium]